jgi:hypothetical protein
MMDTQILAADRLPLGLLSRQGFALLPAMLALRQWGERWETGTPASPVLVDKRDRRPIAPIDVRAWDGRELAKEALIWSLPEDVAGEPPSAEAAE